jgi:hypothetical protein
MKTTLKLLGLATIIVLSSCGTSGIAVIKRKYNSGYYADWNNKKFTTQTNTIASAKPENDKSTISNFKNEAIVKVVNVEENITDTKQKDVNYPLTASNDKGIYIASNETKSFSYIKSTTSASAEKKIETKRESRVAKRVATLLKNKINKSKSGNVSDQTILLVILSLFPILALIAIYIKDGQRITTNFWIDLVLHFIFLYWLFALLVVLDVINLA